jgi:hypothetical protein
MHNIFYTVTASTHHINRQLISATWVNRRMSYKVEQPTAEHITGNEEEVLERW